MAYQRDLWILDQGSEHLHADGRQDDVRGLSVGVGEADHPRRGETRAQEVGLGVESYIRLGHRGLVPTSVRRPAVEKPIDGVLLLGDATFERLNLLPFL